MSLQELLFDIHSVESDVLSANCDLSSLTYEMVTRNTTPAAAVVFTLLWWQEYAEMQSHSSGGGGGGGAELDQVVARLGEARARLEAGAGAQSGCEERLLEARRRVQAEAAALISCGGGAGVALLSVDTQLGLVSICTTVYTLYLHYIYIISTLYKHIYL